LAPGKIPLPAAIPAYKQVRRSDSRRFAEDQGMHRLILGALLLLAGCGDSQFDRVSTGAGTGAGVGAFAGGATTSDQVDLGKPVWKQ